MFSLLPKDDSFFELFERSSSNVHLGAETLRELLDNFDRAPELAKKIEDIEHSGDRVTHEIIERLNKTFITPFDREDIHALASSLDDILDLMDVSVNYMMLYKITGPTEDARQLARCLVESTQLIHEMVTMLRKPEKKVNEILQRGRAVHKLESDADRIEQHALAALFDNEKDSKQIIKWKDIYKGLETATDRCQDASNVIEGIVLKNA